MKMGYRIYDNNSTVKGAPPFENLYGGYFQYWWQFIHCPPSNGQRQLEVSNMVGATINTTDEDTLSGHATRTEAPRGRPTGYAPDIPKDAMMSGDTENQ